MPEMSRYLGTLNEIHGENLKGIREGSVITDRKIDNITKTLDSHTEILDKHTKILDSHTEMIGILMEDVSVLKSDMIIVKEDISVLKSDVIIVKEDISVVKGDLKKRVDYDEFLSLVKRVQKIGIIPKNRGLFCHFSPCGIWLEVLTFNYHD